MKITNINNQDKVRNPHGVDARKIHENEFAQVMHMLLKPGEELTKHTTAVDVFFYVLQGKGIVEVGDEKKEVSVNDLIDSPKNIPHCLYNKSEQDFRVLVVKTPRPNGSQNKQSINSILSSKLSK